MAGPVSANIASQMAPKNQYQPELKRDYVEPGVSSTASDNAEIETIANKIGSGKALSGNEMEAVSKRDTELFRTASKADEERTKLRYKMMEDPASSARVAREALTARAQTTESSNGTDRERERAVTRAMENEARDFIKRFDQKDINRQADSFVGKTQ